MKHEIVDVLEYLSKEFQIKPRGALQIGANIGQEIEAYKRFGIDAAVLVEPIPAIHDILLSAIGENRGYRAVNAVCAEREGEDVVFNVASNAGESSSILPLGTHGEMFPGIVYQSQLEMKSRTVDGIFKEAALDLGFLVVDVQGAELHVLRGAKDYLRTHCRAIFIEVSEMPLYEGGCTLDDLSAFLKPFGFWLKWLNIGPFRIGDALFVKT